MQNPVCARRMRFALLLCLGVLISTIGPLGASSAHTSTETISDANDSIKPDEVVVKFQDDLPYELASELIDQHGARSQAISPRGDLRKLKIPPSKDLIEFLDELREKAEVEFAEPNYRVRALATPNDTQYAQQWALPKILAPSAWDVTTGSDEIVVAILDTGVDLEHPDLRNRLVFGADFVQDDNVPADDNGHGTHIAGIVGATTNNSQGIAGVSWNTKVMPVKVLNSRGEGTSWDVSLGIYHAVDHGAKIINSSFGSHIYSQALAEAVSYAYQNRRLVVAAAGNDSNGAINYPAGNDHVISVGATGKDDSRAPFSNYNASIDVVAPGIDIYSTYKSGSRHGYANGSGTSMAAAFVTGQAALAWGANPALSPDEITNIIKSSAVDLGAVGPDAQYGSGRINLAASLWLPNGVWSDPNPMSPDFDGDNDVATFLYQLSWPGALTIKVYNYLGEVKTLVSNYSQAAGVGHVSWTGTNNRGSVLPNGTYRYTVEVSGTKGKAAYSRTVTLAATRPNITEVWATPNPFAPRATDPETNATSFGYTLSRPAWTTIRVYDYRGEVKTVLDGSWRPKGRHYEGWPGTNDNGNFLAPGTYKYVISARNPGGLTTTSATVTLR